MSRLAEAFDAGGWVRACEGEYRHPGERLILTLDTSTLGKVRGAFVALADESSTTYALSDLLAGNVAEQIRDAARYAPEVRERVGTLQSALEAERQCEKLLAAARVYRAAIPSGDEATKMVAVHALSRLLATTSEVVDSLAEE